MSVEDDAKALYRKIRATRRSYLPLYSKLSEDQKKTLRVMVREHNRRVASAEAAIKRAQEKYDFAVSWEENHVAGVMYIMEKDRTNV